MSQAPDLAQIRFDNAMLLFDEFVHNTIKHPDAATLRGLEGRFAEKVQIQPSYWSQIKSRSRQIGERLARQFEQLCRKPNGWMDQIHRVEGGGSKAAQSTTFSNDSPVPKDDDERFLMGLVLSYYRRHPERARARLLELLGEVLMPTESSAASSSAMSSAQKTSGKPAPISSDPHALWLRSQAGVAPLRRKK